MNSKLRRGLIAVVILVLLIGAGLFIFGSEGEAPSVNDQAATIQTQGSDQAVIDAVSAQQLEAGIAARQVEFESRDPEYPDEEKITYLIYPDGTEDPELHPADALLWGIVQSLAPTPGVRDSVIEFEVYYDEEDDTLASVEAIGERNNTWLFSINYTAVTSFDDLIPTIIHEYAHILSLQDSQTTTEAESPRIREICQEYLVEEGCWNEDSYLGVFYERFWEGQDFDIGRDRTAEEAEDLFTEIDATFVSDYATTNPVEDFAESFGAYVMGDMVNGDAFDQQKLQFFKQFSELVEYRTAVRGAIANWGATL